MAAGLLAFFIALFASLMLVVPLRARALRVGMLDLPGRRKVHHAPVPLLGGLPIYAAVVIAVLLAFHGPARTQIAGILIGASLVEARGRRRVSALEFQARQDFHRSRRRDVLGIPDGRFGSTVKFGEYPPFFGLAGSDPDPGCGHF